VSHGKRIIPVNLVTGGSEGRGPGSDIIYPFAYTGLRWGEMAALKVKRVDLEVTASSVAAGSMLLSRRS
jgi:hypothetical protein